MVNERVVTEDIIQNVFVKLYENLEKIRQKESIAPWIYKTARNEVYEYLRKKNNKREQRIDDDDELSSDDHLESDYDIKELKEIIMSELSKVPEEQKEVYLLKEYSGLSYKEIADIQNIDEELVKSRLFKIRQKIIKRISKLV
jgi:RNA polymerase sigma-70 factor (ECF subfamily)